MLIVLLRAGDSRIYRVYSGGSHEKPDPSKSSDSVVRFFRSPDRTSRNGSGTDTSRIRIRTSCICSFYFHSIPNFSRTTDPSRIRKTCAVYSPPYPTCLHQIQFRGSIEAYTKIYYIDQILFIIAFQFL